MAIQVDLVTFLIENWVLVLAALTSGGMLLWPVVSRGGVGGLMPSAAVQLINREKAVLIDVSEPAEFAAEHAAGAKNVPFGQVATSTALPKNKSLPLVVLCPTGARASRAVGELRKLGFEQAQCLAGGTRAWREASLPIERAVAEPAAEQGR